MASYHLRPQGSGVALVYRRMEEGEIVESAEATYSDMETALASVEAEAEAAEQELTELQEEMAPLKQRARALRRIVRRGA